MTVKQLRMVIMGAPGSGKGTVTGRLLTKFPQIHPLSTGDVLRREIAEKTDLGLKAQKFIQSGKLIDDHTMANLVKRELEKNKWLSSSSFLLDGFPRTVGQARELSYVLHDHPINCVVELDVPREVIMDRICNRWIHPASGRIYNLQYNPPKTPFKDDVTGEDLIQREDDKPETVNVRLDQYYSELDAIRDYYKKIPDIYHVISGSTSDIVAPKLQNLVQHLNYKH